MEYIVASTGRSGSTLLTDLVARAAGRESKYVRDLELFPGLVKKTHMHFPGEPAWEYRALFIYGDVGDSIASMYLGRCDLTLHLQHLEVAATDQRRFWKLADDDRAAAFVYLIEEDRLRMWDNARSWAGSDQTLLVRYEELCDDQAAVMRDMRAHMGLDIEGFEVRDRISRVDDLPPAVHEAIADVYTGFGEGPLFRVRAGHLTG